MLNSVEVLGLRRADFVGAGRRRDRLANGGIDPVNLLRPDTTGKE